MTERSNFNRNPPGAESGGLESDGEIWLTEKCICSGRTFIVMTEVFALRFAAVKKWTATAGAVMDVATIGSAAYAVAEYELKPRIDRVGRHLEVVRWTKNS